MTWLQRNSFQIVMPISVVLAGMMVAWTVPARTDTPPPPWIPTDAGVSAHTSNWNVVAVGPNADPVYVREGRRIYLVDADGGTRRIR